MIAWKKSTSQSEKQEKFLNANASKQARKCNIAKKQKYDNHIVRSQSDNETNSI